MKMRPMRESDLGEVAALLASSFDPALRPYMTYAQEGIDVFLRTRVTNPEDNAERTYLVCADESDRAIAYAELVETEPGLQFLSYICVAPHMKRRGIASSLLEHALRACEEVSRVELEVLHDNESALAMYGKLGFAPVDSGGMWIRRSLPAASGEATPILELPDRAVYEPSHTARGFSELPVRWHGREVRLGRIGSTVLRCFDQEPFVDDSLLAAIRRAFPNLTEAFLISDAVSDIPENGVVVARTTRMARNLKTAGPTQGELE